jgi:hypothetical protein
MGCGINIQGRELSEPELVQIRALRTEHPSWHRTRLSRELCELWGWRNGVGRLKDMACRTLLLKLEARGWIELPPREQAPVNGWRNRRRPEWPHQTTVLEAPLATLGPLRLEPLAAGTPEAGLLGFLLERYPLSRAPQLCGREPPILGVRTPRPSAGLCFVWFGRVDVPSAR